MIVCGAIRLFFSFVSSQIMGSSVTVAVDTIASWFITVYMTYSKESSDFYSIVKLLGN